MGTVGSEAAQSGFVNCLVEFSVWTDVAEAAHGGVSALGVGVARFLYTRSIVSGKALRKSFI